MWHHIYEISWGTPWHPKVSGREVHGCESIQVPMLSRALWWEVAVSFPKDSQGCWGRARMNIKQPAPFLDRTSGRDRRRRKHGEELPRRKERNPIFQMDTFPQVCFPTPTPAWEGLRNHLHHSEGTPPQGSCRSLHHSLHTHPTLVMLRIKNMVSVGCKEVWFGD